VESIAVLLLSDLSTRTTPRMQLTQWTGAALRAGSSECNWPSMTGVSRALVGTERGRGVGAEGGGVGQEAGAGGGRLRGQGQEAEGQGAEGEGGQEASVEGAIPGAEAGIPSQVGTLDPSQEAGVEQRGLLTAYNETGLLPLKKKTNPFFLLQIVTFYVLKKTPCPHMKNIVICDI